MLRDYTYTLLEDYDPKMIKEGSATSINTAINAINNFMAAHKLTASDSVAWDAYAPVNMLLHNTPSACLSSLLGRASRKAAAAAKSPFATKVGYVIGRNGKEINNVEVWAAFTKVLEAIDACTSTKALDDFSLELDEDAVGVGDLICSIYSLDETDMIDDGVGRVVYNDAIGEAISVCAVTALLAKYAELEGKDFTNNVKDDVIKEESNLTEDNNNYRSNTAKNALVDKYFKEYQIDGVEDKSAFKHGCLLHHLNGNHNDDADLENDVLIVPESGNIEDAKLAHKLLHLLSYCYIKDDLEQKLKALNVEFYYHPDTTGTSLPISLETLANGLVQHDKKLRDIALIDQDEADLDALGKNNFRIDR